MKLYQKLRDSDLVDDVKEFRELVWLRAIKVNGHIVDNPNQDVRLDDDITVGVMSIE